MSAPGLAPATEGALREAAAGLDRRSFLRLAGAAAALGLLPAGCGGGRATLAPPPGVTLAALTPRSYAVLNAAAMRLLGPPAAALVAERRVDPARTTDAWLARLPELRAPVQQALLVLELAPWPIVAKLRPFTALDPAAQDAVLDDLMRSRLELKRALFKGVKSFACLSFYAAPEARALTGYPGPFGGGTGAGRAAMAEAMRYPLG